MIGSRTVVDPVEWKSVDWVVASKCLSDPISTWVIVSPDGCGILVGVSTRLVSGLVSSVGAVTGGLVEGLPWIRWGVCGGSNMLIRACGVGSVCKVASMGVLRELASGGDVCRIVCLVVDVAEVLVVGPVDDGVVIGEVALTTVTVSFAAEFCPMEVSVVVTFAGIVAVVAFLIVVEGEGVVVIFGRVFLELVIAFACWVALVLVLALGGVVVVRNPVDVVIDRVVVVVGTTFLDVVVEVAAVVLRVIVLASVGVDVVVFVARVVVLSVDEVVALVVVILVVRMSVDDVGLAVVMGRVGLDAVSKEVIRVEIGGRVVKVEVSGVVVGIGVGERVVEVGVGERVVEVGVGG